MSCAPGQCQLKCLDFKVVTVYLLFVFKQNETPSSTNHWGCYQVISTVCRKETLTELHYGHETE